MNLLRQLTSHRYKIKEAMIFFFDNSDKATEVSEIIFESLTLSKTIISKKIARYLFIIFFFIKLK